MDNVTQRGLLFQDVLQDLRIAVRSLLRAPALALTIVASVGLGLGATAAIFSAINAALLRPLPYAEPDRLVRIYTDTPPFKFRVLGGRLPGVHRTADALRAERHLYRPVRQLPERATPPSSCGRAWCRGGSSPCSASRPSSAAISPSRTAASAQPPVAIASHAFWQQRLGGHADALGRPLRLDGAEYTLIGVLPPTNGPLERRYDVFLIQQFTPPTRKGPFLYSVIARLPRGADRGAATSELHAINRALFPIWQSSYQDDASTWNMEDLKTNLLGDVGTLAGLALAAVGLVWLIACTNASNLLVARATSRQADLAVRTRARCLARTPAAIPPRRECGARRRRGGTRPWRGLGRHAICCNLRRRDTSRARRRSVSTPPWSGSSRHSPSRARCSSASCRRSRRRARSADRRDAIDSHRRRAASAPAGFAVASSRRSSPSPRRCSSSPRCWSRTSIA